MAEEVDATTRQQVLDLIVEKGPVTASAIAKVLGLTTAAVRRHITLLLESKEIAEHEPGAPSKRGRGRLRVTTSPPSEHTSTSPTDTPTWLPRHWDTWGKSGVRKPSSLSRPRARARSSAVRAHRARRGIGPSSPCSGACRRAYAGRIRRDSPRHWRWHASRSTVPGSLPNPERSGGLPPAVRRRDDCLWQAARRARPETFHACGRGTRVHHPHPGGHAHHPPGREECATQVAHR